MFLNQINIWISRLSKADGPLYCGRASSNQMKTRIEQKGWVRRIPPAWLWVGTLAFPAFRLSLKQQLGSQTCWLLDWNSNNEPSRFLGLWTQSGATYTLVLLGLQLTVCRLWDTSGSVIVKSIPYHISFLCIHVCIHLIYKIVCVC